MQSPHCMSSSKLFVCIIVCERFLLNPLIITGYCEEVETNFL